MSDTSTTTQVVANATNDDSGKRRKRTPLETSIEQKRRAMVARFPLLFTVDDNGDTFVSLGSGERVPFGHPVEVNGGFDFLSPDDDLSYFQFTEGEQVSKRDAKDATFRAFVNVVNQKLNDVYGTSKERNAKLQSDLRSALSEKDAVSLQNTILLGILTTQTAPSAEDLRKVGAAWCETVLANAIGGLSEALQQSIADAVLSAFSDDDDDDDDSDTDDLDDDDDDDGDVPS